MVNGDLMVVPQLAEKRAVVGYHMVQVCWDLNGFTLLVPEHGFDVCFGLFNSRGGTLDLHIGPVRALLGHVQNHVELGFELAAGFASSADEMAVLGLRDFNGDGHLVLLLADELFDCIDQAGDYCLLAFEFDSGFIAVSSWELDYAGCSAVVWPAAFHD